MKLKETTRQTSSGQAKAELMFWSQRKVLNKWNCHIVHGFHNKGKINWPRSSKFALRLSWNSDYAGEVWENVPLFALNIRGRYYVDVCVCVCLPEIGTGETGVEHLSSVMRGGVPVNAIPPSFLVNPPFGTGCPPLIGRLAVKLQSNCYEVLFHKKHETFYRRKQILWLPCKIATVSVLKENWRA